MRNSAATSQSYSCTFGTYTQTVWTDRRCLSWSELAKLLTQHTNGPQVIGCCALLQLLLGNIGRPGGGIMALRGHASIQGSPDVTDHWIDDALAGRNARPVAVICPPRSLEAPRREYPLKAGVRQKISRRPITSKPRTAGRDRVSLLLLPATATYLSPDAEVIAGVV